MMYISRDRYVYFHVTNYQGEVYCTVYNVTTMQRYETEQAAIIGTAFAVHSLSEFQPEDNQKYNLLLDFHSNTRTELLDRFINTFNKYFIDMGMRVTLSEDPLILTAHDLEIGEIMAMIDDPMFPRENGLSTYSTWRLSPLAA